MLDALLECQSVTRAARRVGMSTPAMSQALARLRLQFGEPLLVRAGRQMVLTPHAESLRPEVRRLVSAAETLLAREGPTSPAGLEQTFTVHATDHLLTVIGSRLDALIRVEAPGVRVRFLPTAPEDAVVLRKGKADLAVGIYGDLPPELQTRRLFTDQPVCIVRKDHPKVGDTISLQQLGELDHIQVVPRGYPGGYVDDVLARHGVSRRVTCAMPYFLAGLLFVSTTDHVLIGPARVAAAMAGRLGLKIIPPPVALRPYSLSMLWHPRTDESRPHQWLRRLLVRAAEAAAPDVHEDARARLDPSDPTASPRKLRRPRRARR